MSFPFLHIISIFEIRDSSFSSSSQNIPYLPLNKWDWMYKDYWKDWIYDRMADDFANSTNIKGKDWFFNCLWAAARDASAAK